MSNPESKTWTDLLSDSIAPLIGILTPLFTKSAFTEETKDMMAKAIAGYVTKEKAGLKQEVIELRVKLARAEMAREAPAGSAWYAIRDLVAAHPRKPGLYLHRFGRAIDPYVLVRVKQSSWFWWGTLVYKDVDGMRNVENTLASSWLVPNTDL